MAQIPTPVPRFQTISVNEGLSQSSVYALYQDKRGFLWIATGDGLNRYDGSQIKVYRIPAPAGTPPSSFLRASLCEDDSGNIWFSNEYGVHYWSRREDRIITRLRPQAGWRSSDFYATNISSRSLWAFSNSGGVLQYDIINGRYHVYPLPDSIAGSGQPLELDSRVYHGGCIWFKLRRQGAIYRFDIRTGTYSQGLAPGNAISVFFGRSKHFLLAPTTLSIYDSSSKSVRNVGLPGAGGDYGSMSLAEDRWGRIWIGSSTSGLYCFEPATGRVTPYRHSNIKLGSLPINLVPTIYIDRADNLWAGTDGGGICRLDLKPPMFNLFPLNEGDYPVLSDYFIKCFYEDHRGDVWFGTHTNGLCILNKQTGTVRNIQQYSNGVTKRPLRAVGAITEDGDGNIWITHALGFTICDPAAKHFIDIPVSSTPSLAASSVYGTGLCRLQDGRMLAATLTGPVLFSRKNGHWQGRSFMYNKQLGNFTNAVSQSPDGSVWLCLKGAGLLQVAFEADSFRIVRHYLAGLNVRGLHVDGKDSKLLWVATSNGFARLNIQTGGQHFWGVDSGMINTYVYGILEDDAHRLWMSTNGGLVQFDPGTGKLSTFTYADGLQSNEFNSGAYYKGPSGALYFGGIHGFNWFLPGELGYHAVGAPGIALMDLSINGQSRVPGAAGLNLPYTQNNLGFRIAVLDYSRPDANKVAYMLEGWDKSWIESNEETIRYSNLPPGAYKLHIKGRNASGDWSKEEVLPITINPAFWQTTVFYVSLFIMIACVITGIVVLIIRRRVAARLREYERRQLLMEERSRISKDMHDEIGSGLTRIAMMSEGLKLAGLPLHKDDPQKISAAARGLVQSMSEIVWALNPAQDTLESLLAYIREQVNAFVEPYGVETSLHFPVVVPAIVMSNVQRRNLYLVTKEAVNNALKHSGCSRLLLSVQWKDGAVLFEMRDNGKGFCTDEVRSSANGLRNMRKRMEEIGGAFSCTSTTQGTLIAFSVGINERVRCVKQRPTLS